MSASRVAFAAVLVAAAWTTAVSGLVAVGEADAAWLKSAPGAGYAAGLKLQIPGQPVVDATKCNNGNGGPTATLHWSYPAALPPGFEVLTSLTQNSASPTTTATTATSVTVPLLSTSKTTYVSVRATTGTWKGTRSTEVAAC